MHDSPGSSGASERDAVVHRWTRKAEADLRNAEYTLTLHEDCPFETVGFHAQQCVEKYLKALLVAHDMEVPKTHDVRRLAQLLVDDQVLPDGIDLLVLNDLTGYAVDARYPDDDDEPLDRVAAEAAVTLAKEIRAVIRAVLPQMDQEQHRLL